MSQFIGKGENKTEYILQRIFPSAEIFPQYPLQGLIHKNDFDWLDPEVKKHKFDFFVKIHRKRNFVVEVNYKHKEKAAAKYRKIFGPELKKVNIGFVNINDWDCMTLFKPKMHFQDFIDVCNALITSEIKY
ncbi:MAG: hypothetical protein ACXADH_01120 [Candidatus Kariarchaeaceae archaeon]|jgi:hypothetical protein